MTFQWFRTFAVAAVLGAFGACAVPNAIQKTPVVERIERGTLVMENIPDVPLGVAERLRQYQSVRDHRFVGWLGDAILISTRFGDVLQIHRVEAPAGARQQITFYDEPVRNAFANPRGQSFLFTKDTGGDEFFQGYYVDVTNGDVTTFTEPGTRNRGFSWSGDGSTVVWYRALRGEADWDILAGNPTDPDSIRVIYEGDGAITPIDVDTRGDMVLVLQIISISKNRLFILDVVNGGLIELNPGLDVAYKGGLFLPDGSILTATDRGGEYINLVRLDPGDGRMTSYTDGVSWNVEDFDLSPDGETVVFTVNEGGLISLKMLDLTTGSIGDGPVLPVGVALRPRFNRDGTAVAFSFSASTDPFDVWSFEVDTLELTSWTNAEVGGLDRSVFAAAEMFEYPNADGMDIPAFMYRPDGVGPHPVIISIHGGPENHARPAFSSIYQYWVNVLDAAVVVPNVRGSSGFGKTYVGLDNGLNRKRPVEDIGALLDWIASQPDLDSERVVVHGGSYGGYMVLASMIDYADRLAGGVNIVGISDFRTFLENTQDYRRDLRRVEYGDERDPEIAAFFEEISPLRNADMITKPLFIVQGFNDPKVPYTEAEQILSAVRASGGDAWYLMAMDEGHGFQKKSNLSFQRAAETLFFRYVFNKENEIE